MKSPGRNYLMCFVVVSSLVGVASNALAANETTVPGTQVMVAHHARTPVVVDGIFSPREWSAAVPVHVNGNKPGGAPGVVPNLPFLPFLFPPDNEQDSSFTIYTLYDNNNLYVAVDVVDDTLINDGPVPYLDDDAEVTIDGDNRPDDLLFALICGPANPDCPHQVQNNEGFQLITSVGGDTLTVPQDNPNIIWESKTGPRPRGFLAEFRIPLDSINTIDTSWFSGGNPDGGFRRSGPGDTIGFNVSVGDDDNGGLSYFRSEPGAQTDSATAWDGSSLNWFYAAEQDWGNLYFAND